MQLSVSGVVKRGGEHGRVEEGRKNSPRKWLFRIYSASVAAQIGEEACPNAGIGKGEKREKEVEYPSQEKQ